MDLAVTVVQASPGAEWERDSLQSLSKTGSLLFTAGRTYHAGIETLALCCGFLFYLVMYITLKDGLNNFCSMEPL